MKMVCLAFMLVLVNTPTFACDEKVYRETILDLERQITQQRRVERRLTERIKVLEAEARREADGRNPLRN